MSEEQTPPNPTKPHYYVPSALVADNDESNNVEGWIAIHCFAFGLSCLIFALLVVGCIFIFGAFDRTASPTQAPISKSFSLIFVVGVPAFASIYAASLLQWSVVGDGINRSTWLNNSATVGTVGVLAWIYYKLPITFPSLGDYTLFVFQSFALISSIISWVQWLELRKTTQRAWLWMLISIGIWTGIGTLVLGGGIIYALKAMSGK
ncbi:hypothetical protein [Herpetosiphon llansteffanensis]|uniref:hypothetical protein n=1 Tax=Herpetosiphon llansteffanensis TaxID=2094568 RepID=UPI000D7C8D29|nr:hypothetical protein [Herpetosiphon llansteffanensis]